MEAVFTNSCNLFSNNLEAFAESYNFLTKKNFDVNFEAFKSAFPESIQTTRNILEDNGLSIP